MWIRQKSKNSLPPPAVYDFHEPVVTLCVHWGGKFILEPKARYIGGDLFKCDYVTMEAMKLPTIRDMCETMGVTSHGVLYSLSTECFVWVDCDDELQSLFNLIHSSPTKELHLFLDPYVLDKGQMVNPNPLTNEESTLDYDDKHDAKSQGDDDYGELDAYEEESRKVSFSDSDDLEHFSDSDIDVQSDINSEAEDENDSDYVGTLRRDLYEFDDSLFDQFVDHKIMDPVDGDFDTTEHGYGRGCRSAEIVNNGTSDESDNDLTDSDSGDEDVLISEDEFASANSESDEDVIGSKFKIFNKSDKFKPDFALGMKFNNRDDLRNAVNCHAVATRRSLQVTKEDHRRLYAICRSRKCKWTLTAVYLKKEKTWQINKYNEKHSKHRCSKTAKVKNLTSRYVAERFSYMWASDETRKIEGVVSDVLKITGCQISKEQAYRAKRLALNMLRGDPSEQYTLLWDYRDEVLRSNPGSSVLLQPDDDGKFYRMYVCLKALKDGFRNGCRHVVGVDGCHLKGPYGGVLLTAVGVDPNNNIYPIAWAMVTKEDGENWIWFLRALRRDLQIEHHETWTFMSDKQKGLLVAFDEVFNGSKHRFCVRHLHGNMKRAGFGGMAIKDALWKAARASTVNDFIKALEDMRKIDPEVVEWLDDKPASQWSKSHFETYPKCDILLNNGCESFNNAIKPARVKGIMSMFEWLHDYCMRRLQVNRDRARDRWKGVVCPKIKKLIDKYTEKVGDFTTLKSSDSLYRVEISELEAYVVDLSARTCACRRWDLSGIPCVHAVSAIFSTGDVPLDYVHEFYHLNTYKRVYDYVISPINGRSMWGKSGVQPILPPNGGPKVGRPAGGARRPEEGEVVSKKKKTKGRPLALSKTNPGRTKRQQDSCKCSYCKIEGHNKRTCAKKRDDEAAKLLSEEYNMIIGEEMENHAPSTSKRVQKLPVVRRHGSITMTTIEPTFAPTSTRVPTKKSNNGGDISVTPSRKIFKSTLHASTSQASPSPFVTASQLLQPQTFQAPPTMHQQVQHVHQGMSIIQTTSSNERSAVSDPLRPRSHVERPLFSSKNMRM